MISWIQRTFQQHFRFLFLVLLAGIIVSFIFITNASSGLGSADRKSQHRDFFDLNIGEGSTRSELMGQTEDSKRILNEATLAMELTYGQVPFRSQQQLEGYALTRYATLHLADELHVPAPSKAELTEHIKTLRTFAGTDGQFDAKKYADFRKMLTSGQSISEAQVFHILSDNLRIERVTKLVAGPGYTLPADVKAELTIADTRWTLATASIDRASFTPDIKPTEAELEKYFEENAPTYTIPEQVSVSYVEFNNDAFLAALPAPQETDVRAFYDNNSSRFPNPDRKPGETANPDTDYLKVRPQVEAALKRSAASRVAATAAGEFSLALYNNKLAPGTPAFDAYLAEHKMTLKNVPPFSHENVPAELGQNPAIPNEALKLNKDRLVSDAIPTEKGSVILFWKENIPSRQPGFAEVRAKVAADYVANETEKRFVALGKTIRSQIQARLKAGDSFEKAANAAASSAGVKVEVKTLPAFTLRQPPQDFNGELFSALQNLNQGEVAEMVPSAGKGIFAYAQEKKLPDLSETNAQYATVSARIAESNAAANGQAFFRELVTQELDRTAIKTTP